MPDPTVKAQDSSNALIGPTSPIATGAARKPAKKPPRKPARKVPKKPTRKPAKKIKKAKKK